MKTTKNELIAVIDDCRALGLGVRSIRKQKFDPSNFYMTRTDGKQLGPIKCEGDTAQLNGKFGEAISYLNGMGSARKRTMQRAHKRVVAA